MLLQEIMGLGDDNIIGRLVNDAKNTLTLLTKQSNKEVKSLSKGLLTTLQHIEVNPNILQVDGYSLTNLLQLLTKPKVDIKTLRMVSDALNSYEDDSSD